MNPYLVFTLIFVLAGIASGAQPGLEAGTRQYLAPSLEQRLIRFFTEKEEQARKLAKEEGHEQAPEVWQFFDAGKNGDWSMVEDLYQKLRSRAYQYQGAKPDERLKTIVWQPVNECFGAYDECNSSDEKYVNRFAQGILNSMPPGSIYFGGTDPGRWLVTAFCKAHPAADPCFVITQNALADALYMEYLRAMYGSRLKLPSAQDSQNAFTEYVNDAQERLKQGKLRPGENVQEIDNRVNVSGQIAVMGINGLLAKWIFQNNPDREIFVEESFPLDWMYAYLAPHGLIMKLERKPPAELDPLVVQKDHAYWTRLVDDALGPWLTSATPMPQVCDFALKIFNRRETNQFKGDVGFVRNDATCKTYSKLRSSIAHLYVWRSKHSASPQEKARMQTEADFAFRQSFAMCPYSPEAVAGWAELLIEVGHQPDALLLARAAEKISGGNSVISNLLLQLEQLEGEKDRHEAE